MNAPTNIVGRPRNVRVANQTDIAALYWLLRDDLHADNDLGETVSEAKLADHVSRCCMGIGAIAGLIEEDGRIVGSIGIVLMQSWYSSDWHPAEIWLFVKPEARKGRRYYDDLFRFAQWHKQEISDDMGRDVPVIVGVSSLNRLPAKIRLWSRYGKMIAAQFELRGRS